MKAIHNYATDTLKIQTKTAQMTITNMLEDPQDGKEKKIKQQTQTHAVRCQGGGCTSQPVGLLGANEQRCRHIL